jgi:hypothetical protein
MGSPLRRSDGTLVSAQIGDNTGFADIAATPIPNPTQPDLWKAPGSIGYGRAWSDPQMDIQGQPSAGREYVLTTDRELQIGPHPGKIARQAVAGNAGLVGPDIQNSFPPDANMGYMKHLPIAKLTQNATPALKTIADDAWMPGVFAGNPVG